ncbi:cytochrome d ubiquinol oxidase subunit II [Bacillus sp. 28A-2]|uniref:cytochrome d ubiquinol oxidase subunit II n=1 Tax=Bacillus TaxID=1386 RepID=UPI001071FF26|nr:MULTISPECIES: cytochrome d ubiquinol oxidase subunit II [Bacillus]MBD3861627.1 cytochrome d ubiquinol oxidase subunit II [Bacillus sp. 28A-2]QEO60806.1 cytochrome d ubiquinol oxidase subunit II [Bacillus altitudinis]
MNLEIIGISILWLFLFGYVIIGSVDYGAGFFNAYSILRGKQHLISDVIQRYLSPVWEVTNVFFVFFMVGMIGFFPRSAYFFGSTLLIPGSIALVLMIIRGSYYAFEAYGARGHRGYAILYGASGLLIPAALSIVLTLSEGGFISISSGNPSLDYVALFTSPLTWSIVVLSIISVLYISAVFLLWYADKAEDQEAVRLMRRYALIWCIPLIVASLGIIIELKDHNIVHYNRMFELWWLFAISFVFWLGTFWLILKQGSYFRALLMLIGQFAFAFFGYGISHYPYLLYPYLTIHDGFTNNTMATALIIAFLLGLVLLIPSLYLLMRFFLFDKQYIKGKRK